MPKSTSKLNLSIRCALAILLGIGIWGSWIQLESSVEYQKSAQLYESALISKTPDRESLVALANSIRKLDDESKISGVYSGFKARVESFISAHENTNPIVSDTELIASYGRAVTYFPYDGFLWAQYAYQLIDTKGVDEISYAALDNAASLGINDYQTLRVLAFIAIRQWPHLSCEYKRVMLRAITNALQLNDHILIWWNVQQGYKPIGRYVNAVMEAHKFDLSWAHTQVDVCTKNSIQALD